MRILFAHTAYRQRGGEDAVVEAESSLLERAGHRVERFVLSNESLADAPALAAAAGSLWSAEAAAAISRRIAEFVPDVIHVHNTFPAMSPSVLWAAARHQVPVVKTLHNFRLLCPQAMLLRDGRPCEDCVGTAPWRGVVRRCYRGSVGASAVAAATVTLHRWAGTWHRKVARFVALNDFCRRKFIEGGLPAARIVVKPNFVEAPAAPAGNALRAGGLFVGRLSPEKGLDLLAEAVRGLPAGAVTVIGDGEHADLARDVFGDRFLGFRPLPEILAAMRAAAFLVVPSRWYENFPRTIVEAFASGLPVITSRHGALAEIVRDGRTGLHFTPGDAADLRAKIEWAIAHPGEMARMGRHARLEYDERYTPQRTLAQLETLYQTVVREGHGQVPHVA